MLSGLFEPFWVNSLNNDFVLKTFVYVEELRQVLRMAPYEIICAVGIR